MIIYNMSSYEMLLLITEHINIHKNVPLLLQTWWSYICLCFTDILIIKRCLKRCQAASFLRALGCSRAAADSGEDDWAVGVEVGRLGWQARTGCCTAFNNYRKRDQASCTMGEALANYCLSASINLNLSSQKVGTLDGRGSWNWPQLARFVN